MVDEANQVTRWNKSERFMQTHKIYPGCRAMTLSEVSGTEGSSSLPLLLRNSARKLGRKASAPLTLKQSPYSSTSGRHDNKAIFPASTSSTSCIFIDTSACCCDTEWAFPLILRILNLITRSGRQIPHATRSILDTTTPSASYTPPIRLHRNL